RCVQRTMEGAGTFSLAGDGARPPSVPLSSRCVLPVSCPDAQPPSATQPDQAGGRQVKSPVTTLTVPDERSTTITNRALKRSPEGFVRMSVSLNISTWPLRTYESVP